MRLLTLFLFAFVPQAVSPHASVRMTPAPELHGIDVSHYQEAIEWDTVVAKQRLDFVFVKCTEGSDYVDSLYCQNWTDLGRLGVRRGAYHFFRAYGCGEDQAAHFLQAAELQPGDLAPVLDIETTSGMSPEIMIEEARVW
ncbi:MAG: GH25 family lysozyme, partial [Saprospiraceae bacterium]